MIGSGTGGDSSAPRSQSPLVNELCDRLGARYGGWDTLAPLPGPEQGTIVSFHIDDGTVVDRDPALRGTGVVRTGKAFADRVEVWDGETLLATHHDLSVRNLFGP